MMKKRFLATLMIICMIVSLLPAAAFAGAGDSLIGSPGATGGTRHTHDENCGYEAAVPETCSHLNADGTYRCSPDPTATPGDAADGYVCDHTDGCEYTPGTPGHPCGFVPGDDVISDSDDSGDLRQDDGATLSDAVALLALPREATPSNAAGDFTVEGDINGYSFNENTGVLTIKGGAIVTIRNTDPSAPTSDRIKVNSGGTAQITLAGVNIEVTFGDSCAFDMSGATVVLTLAANSKNTLESHGRSNAGLEAPGGSTLTIDGDGELEAKGEESGAGIGGRDGGGGGTISISGNARVTASSGRGAGIGGGMYGGGGTISISGETRVTASSGRGAGIGGGGDGGGGGDSGGGDIRISGNAVVFAAGGDNASHIGAGEGGSPGTVNKTGGVIFEGKKGEVYGNVTLPGELDIDPKYTLTIPEKCTLTVPKDVTLDNNGTITGSGTLTGNGTFKGYGNYALKVARTIAPPTYASVTSSSVTLNAVSMLGGGTVEYAKKVTDAAPGGEEGNWQTDPAFTDLAAGTSYYFYVRVTGDSIYADAVSGSLKVKTAPLVTIQQGQIQGVTSPARGETPVSAITATDEYTGTVTWSPAPGGTFAADTVYTATITLTPKEGYILDGVLANSFIVPGAAATNAADSGTIAAVFPMTGAVPAYTIEADAAALDFGGATVGYTALPAEQTVTVTNTGNQPVTLAQPTAPAGYTAGTLSDTTLAADGTATFTVRPQAGLAVGSYNETLTVSGDNGASATVNLAFTVTDKPTYTVAVTGGTGGGSYEAGAAVTITATVPDGKQFTGWTVTPDVTFTGGGKNTAAATFTMPDGAVTAAAGFEDKPEDKPSGNTGNSGGSSHDSDDSSSANSVSAYVPPTVTAAAPGKPGDPAVSEIVMQGKADKDGNAVITVPDSVMNDAIKKAQDAAKANGGTADGGTANGGTADGVRDGGIAITVKATGTENAAGMVTNLSAASVKALAGAGVKKLTIECAPLKVTLDLASLQTLFSVGGDVKLTALKQDAGALSAAAQGAIGGRPAYRLAATAGITAVTAFGGTVFIAIPCTPGPSEDPARLCGVYVDDGGAVTWLPGSGYDANLKAVVLSTNHFSAFGIGYR